MDAKRLAEALKSLDNQNFGPNDSTILSTINHPVNAGGKFLDWLKNQVNTAAGIPDQYDNPNPLLAPSPEAQSQAAFDLAGMAQVGSMPFAPKSSGGTLGSITTYHGSPHKFDKFDMSKIGTGEGAQAYGHGLYFAEHPDTAKTYATIKQQEWRDKIPLKQYHAESARARGDLEREAQLLKEVEDLKANMPGNLYKTSLEWPDPAREAADPLGPQHFLDWDKPLSEQPESVKGAWQSMFGDIPEPKGPIGRTLKGLMAEDDLKAQGIPGIRYLDGGSRGAGEGSYNYVVFDDQIPKIVERNGQPLQSDNLNAGLIAKYLREGQLSPQELAQYETNAVQMTDSGKHHFNLANANAQGGTPESRAVDLGFDTPAFHGTNADIQEFDYKYTGNGNDQFGSGFYTDTRPNVASGYANGEGAAVYPLMVNIKKPLDSEFEKTLTKKQITDIIKGSPNLKDALYNYDDVDYYGINKVLKDAVNQNHEYQSEKLLDNLHPLNNDFYRGEPEKFSQAVNKATGYDSVKVNFDDGKHLIPWFPNQIRSRFAAFDPLRKDSANLLATRLLPATMLGYGMANQKPDNQSIAEALREGN